MFRKGTAGSMLSATMAGVVIIGMMYSCSNAESPAPKSASTKKKTAESAQSVTKVITSSTTPDTTTAVALKETRTIVVYYFHGDARCPTCFKLENYAKTEIESSFADAMKSGKLEWKTINVETAGNEHFGTEYKLYTKSVIVSTQKDGKEESWKNLDQIWQLVHEEKKYRAYIKNEVKACLEGKCL